MPVHLGVSGVIEGDPDQPLVISGGLTGSGTVSDATLGGTIDIGSSLGILSLEDVEVGSNTVFNFEIAGASMADYDRLLLVGDTALTGILNIELTNKFDPQSGDVFDILDFESANLSGLFDMVNLPALTSGLNWDQTNLYTTGELGVSSLQIPGDFDSDGDADGDDFLVWQNGFPTSTGATLLDGDADGDEDVDGDDFLIWQNSFPYPAALSKTPEPASLGLLALGGLLMLRRRAVR